MNNTDLEARLDDLRQKCDSQAIVTCTYFLSPAEQQQATIHCRKTGASNLYFFGGNGNAERKIGFFLPYYESAESFNPSEYVIAIKAETRFANLSHRDFLGALTSLGIKRSCIGDIYPFKDQCYFYVVPVMAQYISDNFTKAGRAGIKLSQVGLNDVPSPEGKCENREFTVKSMRLDAVSAGMFALSRSEAAREIEQGLVFLNHTPCLETDANVGLSDLISIRGQGRGRVVKCDGYSRKGRIFVICEMYL